MLLFEKIADVFEAIAHTLPLYRQIYEVCNRCTSDPHLKEDDLHLATLMSYVYFDTVQLLLEIYRIFCRGTQGTLHTFFMFGPLVNSSIRHPNQKCIGYHEWFSPVHFELGHSCLILVVLRFTPFPLPAVPNINGRLQPVLLYSELV